MCNFPSQILGFFAPYPFSALAVYYDDEAPVITATFPAHLSAIELFSFASLMPEYKCSDAQREDSRTP